MIAHAAGLPLEETLVQLAPAAAGATLAAGLLIERARCWLRSLDPGNRTRQSSDDEGEES